VGAYIWGHVGRIDPAQRTLRYDVLLMLADVKTTGRYAHLACVALSGIGPRIPPLPGRPPLRPSLPLSQLPVL
jgi:hypothetical protein